MWARTVTDNWPASCLGGQTVQVGPQGIGGEVFFPQPRRELGDAGSGVLGDALEHIDEVGVGIDAVQATGHDQALDDADVAGAELCPAKKPRPSAHGNYPEGAFDVIRMCAFGRRA